MFYSIDRFEEDIAVLISDKDSSIIIYASRKHIPSDAKEGSILTLKDGEYIHDHDETAKRRKALFLRTRKLSKNNKK